MTDGCLMTLCLRGVSAYSLEGGRPVPIAADTWPAMGFRREIVTSWKFCSRKPGVLEIPGLDSL